MQNGGYQVGMVVANTLVLYIYSGLRKKVGNIGVRRFFMVCVSRDRFFFNRIVLFCRSSVPQLWRICSGAHMPFGLVALVLVWSCQNPIRRMVAEWFSFNVRLFCEDGSVFRYVCTGVPGYDFSAAL